MGFFGPGCESLQIMQRGGCHSLVPGLIRIAAALPGLAHTQAAGTRVRHQEINPWNTDRRSVRMFVIGVDAHKKSHCLIVVDETGRQQAQKTVDATPAGHEAALRWARRRYPDDELTWAIEDARHVSGGLERFLLASGQRCVRVPTRLMARSRHETSREPGKSDPIDARSAARAFLREPDLPVACHDDDSRELKLLVDRREALVEQRTATWNRLLWRIHEIAPAREVGPLDLARHRERLQRWLLGQEGITAELALTELDDIARLTAEANALERRIERRVKEIAPSLLALTGVGGLTAAKIIGETALVTRFGGRESAFARFAGVAPSPRWSGGSAGRMRRSKTGNRNLNSALHRICVTQLRVADSEGRAYFDRKVAEGHTPAMALRCLKRKVSRVVFMRLCADYRRRHPTAEAPSTWGAATSGAREEVTND